MKRTFALLFIVSSLIGTKAFSQSCPSSVIFDTTNNLVRSGQTIQLTCEMPSVILSPQNFAPGASDSYTYESIPFNPPCSFTLSEYPNKIDYILPQDDVWGEVMSLDFGQPSTAQPFIFSFYGQNNLNQCVVGSNAVLSWNLSVASGNNFNPSNYCSYSAGINIPSTNPEFLNCIFAPYHDIYFSATQNWGKMYFYIAGEYPCRKLIISFYDVPLFGNTSVHATSMLVLYETTNTIEFYLPSKTCCTSTNSGNATLGIQNATGTQATVITNSAGVTYNSTNWTATNEAWRIRPAGELGSYSEWYRRPVAGGARVPVPANANYQITANPNSTDGPQYYIMETKIVRLDGVELSYSDSCIVKPIDLPAFVITHNGHTSYNDTICEGSNMNIQLSGGSIYRMIAPISQDVVDPNSIIVSPLVNTTYIFEVDNYNENQELVCTRRDSFNVQPYSFNVELGDNKIICKNDSVTLWNTNELVSGSCQWYDNNHNPLNLIDTLIIKPQSTGYIYLTLTDRLTCQASDSILINVNNAPDVYITGDSIICEGTSTKLTANSSLPNCTYEWNTGQTTPDATVSPSQPETEYEVSVKSQPAMCEKIAKITVTSLSKPTVSVCPDINICYSDTTQIYVTGNAVSYSWSANPSDANVDNNHSTNITVRPQASTMYVATGNNEIGCLNSDTTFVYVSPLPQAQMSFSPAIIDDLDPTVIFRDETSGSVLRRWNLSDESTSAESIFVHIFNLADSNQSYAINLYVQNDAGCEDSITNIIRVSKTHYLWAPNGVYIYDADPRISQFRVYIDNPIDFELKIFNRWGECVYKTNDQEKAWDCKYKGEFVQQGTYVWMVNYRHSNKRNDVITDKGTFSIYK
ncbi:MAG: gliding motility-associated C-terminal domain-containing protein [Bacteroidales bacterium]|jgi:gliding motility-associated-like protein